MNNDLDYIPAGNTTYPNPIDTIKHMEETTEKTFEFSVMSKDRNIFWIMYLTDKLSDNWGFTVMLWDWTLINVTRSKKWWKCFKGSGKDDTR